MNQPVSDPGYGGLSWSRCVANVDLLDRSALSPAKSHKPHKLCKEFSAIVSVDPLFKFRVLLSAFLITIFAVLSAPVSAASSTAFKDAVQEASANDPVLSAFYRSQSFEGLWTNRGSKPRIRRNALLKALEDAPKHGLPADRYRLEEIKELLKSARKPADRGRLDVEISKIFLVYGKDIGSGVVNPRTVSEEIARRRPVRDPASLLNGIRASAPKQYLAALAPRTIEYQGLLEAKEGLEKIRQNGGWGPILAMKTLRPGDSGNDVAALKRRLQAMGYLKRRSGDTFDPETEIAVKRFQASHGLIDDAVVGPGTLGMLNSSIEVRLGQIIAALERERWMNFPRGERHVEVNITDFTAKIVDNGKTTFETIAVTGAADDDRRTPEFSDEMEFMIFNPSWYVPASIATDEYLPLFQEDPNSLDHLQLLTQEHEPVDRASVDFASLDEDNWPFFLREPPSQTNALGLVKFMFPNRHNIYLHDTPQKSLFAKEMRAFSHGCVRLENPFGFATALLARQLSDPAKQITEALEFDGEYQVDLREHVPVHIIYRTALINEAGGLEFRRDIYGRDAMVLNYLRRAGVQI